MNRIKTVTAAIIATLVLTPTLTGCYRTTKPTCTDDAFVLTVAGQPKPPAPKAPPAVKPPAVKPPVVKEPKRDGNGGVIVDNGNNTNIKPGKTKRIDIDDDCDDDDD